ncbi:MAG: SCO family protein [Sulfuritalea sp.]|nr:SCO family protein [Sulfuritalea sp.]
MGYASDMNPRPGLCRTLLCGLLCAISCAAPAAGTTAFHGTEIGRVRSYAQDFTLTDHNGKPRTLADFRGKAVVLFFGYLQCPNYCPMTLARLAEVMHLLGDDAKRVQVLFVTVDPERDTPMALKEYVANFHPSFLGLYTTPAQTPELALKFRIYYRKVPSSTPGYYNIDHAVFSYAYDPDGHLRLRLSDALSATDIAADLRLLLRKN